MMAVTIIAIMSGLVWSSFGRLLSVTRDIEVRDDYWHGVRIAMNRLTREISMAFISDNFDKARYRADDPDGRPTFFIIEDGGERDRLAFTAFVHRRLYRDEKNSDQAIVDYRLDRDDDGVEGLFRRVKTQIDSDWERGGDKNLLLAGVTAFDVQWWNPDDEAWESRFSTKNSDQHNLIPSRLRVTLKLLDPDGKEQSFSTQTRVMLNTPLQW